MKPLSFALIFLLVSCATNPENNKSNKYLSAKDKESVEKILGQNISKSVDLYPIPPTDIQTPNKVYELPMPGQYFSSDSENELRLHKLGEIRWIYLSLEPSKAWPMLQEYLKNDNDLSISKSNPKTGEIFTKETNRNNIKNRFVFKVERGLQRESTEIFISNEVFNGTSWNKKHEVIKSKLSSLKFKFSLTLSPIAFPAISASFVLISAVPRVPRSPLVKSIIPTFKFCSICFIKVPPQPNSTSSG